ncbi:MAG: transposase [Planctomycetota bacterium]|jgi:hypothetical protein
MSNTSTPSTSYRFSARASLAAVGLRLRRLNLFGPLKAQVHIDQKVVTHTPVQKLYDAFIAILAGAHGLVEINKRLRADPGLQMAFGRTACAEQSVVQETLDACTEANVTQMQQATDAIYRCHSWGYRHDYTRSLQVLDMDMTGMPCGKKAAFATKGYFANQRNRRGRQLGRVLATRYDEIVEDRLFGGKTQLTKALRPLVEATEQSLELDDDRRCRTLWRIDAGGGSVAEVNWLLKRGYQVHCKDYSGTRAKTLAQSVTEWVDDPRIPERQVGWVTVAPTAYRRPVRRVAVRCRKKNGQWGVGVLISTLAPHEVIELTRQPVDRLKDPTAVLMAYVYLYDQRGGGVETAIKGDKQGLGITKRNKKRFEAQQMVTQLNVLAHNTIVWARRWLTPSMPSLRKWGMLRMVRDVFHVSGQLVFDHQHRIVQIRLNPMDPLAQGLLSGFGALLESEHIVVTLGET